MYQTNASSEAYKYIYNLLHDFSQKNGSNFLSGENMAYLLQSESNKRSYNNYNIRKNVISASFDNINNSNEAFYKARTNFNENTDENYQYRNVFFNANIDVCFNLFFEFIEIKNRQKLLVTRHGERVDSIFGRNWISNAFDQYGK